MMISPSSTQAGTATEGTALLNDQQAQPKILIVDDHPVITQALSSVIRRSGFTTTCFNSGREAIAYAQANPVDAVILDIHMPDISGLVVSQILRETLGQRVPIIILSGDVSMETINSLPHIGATWFLSKPVRADQIIEHLTRLLAA